MLEKLGAVTGVPNPAIYAAFKGMSLDDLQKTRTRRLRTVWLARTTRTSSGQIAEPKAGLALALTSGRQETRNARRGGRARGDR